MTLESTNCHPGPKDARARRLGDLKYKTNRTRIEEKNAEVIMTHDPPVLSAGVALEEHGYGCVTEAWCSQKPEA